MIPTENKMEDLSGLERLLPSMALGLLFARTDANIGRQLSMYRRLYVRLIDKALDEYQSGRGCIIAQVAEGQRSAEAMAKSGRYLYMWKFIDHMENCISTTRRILRILDFLKRDKGRAGLDLGLPRPVLKQVGALDQSIVGIRGVLEHLDERIQQDRIQQDESIMLRLSKDQDAIEIANMRLKLVMLSNLIRRLHELGRHISTWRGPDDASPNATPDEAEIDY